MRYKSLREKYKEGKGRGKGVGRRRGRGREGEKARQAQDTGERKEWDRDRDRESGTRRQCPPPASSHISPCLPHDRGSRRAGQRSRPTCGSGCCWLPLRPAAQLPTEPCPAAERILCGPRAPESQINPARSDKYRQLNENRCKNVWICVGLSMTPITFFKSMDPLPKLSLRSTDT